MNCIDIENIINTSLRHQIIKLNVLLKYIQEMKNQNLYYDNDTKFCISKSVKFKQTKAVQ